MAKNRGFRVWQMVTQVKGQQKQKFFHFNPLGKALSLGFLIIFTPPKNRNVIFLKQPNLSNAVLYIPKLKKVVFPCSPQLQGSLNTRTTQNMPIEESK